MKVTRRVVGTSEAFQQGKTYELVLEVSGALRRFDRETIQNHLRTQLQSPTLQVMDWVQGTTTRVAFMIPDRAGVAAVATEANQGVELGEIQALVIPVLVWQIGAAILAALVVLLIIGKIKEIVELIIEATPEPVRAASALAFPIAALAALLGAGWLWYRSLRP